MIVEEANRLAELQLSSEVNLMLAADQRATTFAGIMIAAVAIIAQQYAGDTSALHDDIGLLLLGASAGLATFSARSVRIHVAGNSFTNFEEDIKNKRDFDLVLRDLGGIYDNCSKLNRAVLKKNARLFNASLYLGVLGFLTTLWPSFRTVLQTIVDTTIQTCGVTP